VNFPTLTQVRTSLWSASSDEEKDDDDEEEEEEEEKGLTPLGTTASSPSIITSTSSTSSTSSTRTKTEDAAFFGPALPPNLVPGPTEAKEEEDMEEEGDVQAEVITKEMTKMGDDDEYDEVRDLFEIDAIAGDAIIGDPYEDLEVVPGGVVDRLERGDVAGLEPLWTELLGDLVATERSGRSGRPTTTPTPSGSGYRLSHEGRAALEEFGMDPEEYLRAMGGPEGEAFRAPQLRLEVAVEEALRGGMKLEDVVAVVERVAALMTQEGRGGIKE
jgi:hypothetical protein